MVTWANKEFRAMAWTGPAPRKSNQLPQEKEAEDPREMKALRGCATELPMGQPILPLDPSRPALCISQCQEQLPDRLVSELGDSKQPLLGVPLNAVSSIEEGHGVWNGGRVIGRRGGQQPRPAQEDVADLLHAGLPLDPVGWPRALLRPPGRLPRLLHPCRVLPDYDVPVGLLSLAMALRSRIGL